MRTVSSAYADRNSFNGDEVSLLGDGGGGCTVMSHE